MMALTIFFVCVILMALMIPSEIWKFLFNTLMFLGLGFIAWVALIFYFTS